MQDDLKALGISSKPYIVRKTWRRNEASRSSNSYASESMTARVVEGSDRAACDEGVAGASGRIEVFSKAVGNVPEDVRRKPYRGCATGRPRRFSTSCGSDSSRSGDPRASYSCSTIFRSLWILRSRTRNFSFIGQLSEILDRLGDRAYSRTQIHVSFQSLLQSLPKGTLRLEALTVDRHVHVGTRMEPSGLDDGAKQVDGAELRKIRGQPGEWPPSPASGRRGGASLVVLAARGRAGRDTHGRAAGPFRPSSFQCTFF